MSNFNLLNVTNYNYVVFATTSLAITVILSYSIRKLLTAIIRKNSKILGVEETTYVFLKNSVSFVLYTICIFWVFYKIPYFKSLGSALFAGAGILAAIIGFASQKAFSNIISGLFILMFKPFKVGDIIEINMNKKGTVEEITLRHTVIRDFEFRRVIVPNSVISDETITNSSITDEKIRKQINFNIGYTSDLNLAKNIITKHIENHPFSIDNRSNEEIQENQEKVVIRMVEWGEYYITLRAYAWTMDFENSFQLYCDVLESIKKEFQEVGIEIPFPRRDIELLNSKTLNNDE